MFIPVIAIISAIAMGSSVGEYRHKYEDDR